MVSNPTSQRISCLAVTDDITLAGCGSSILIFRRQKLSAEISTNIEGSFFQMETLGDNLLALSESGVFQYYNIKDRELYTQIDFPTEKFQPTSFLHPSTYLNKILFGSQQGTMQLWNIKHRKLIHEFKSFGSPITCMVQSPVVDVVGIGLLDGTILLYNIRTDQKLFSFQQVGKVTTLSFRTDGESHLASANLEGVIYIWDLDKSRLFHTIKDAHRNSVSSLHYLTNQPVLISSGEDNSIVQWIFDTHEGFPRVLRSRNGHFQPPTQIQHYDQDGHFILSASRDLSFRVFSAFKDAQNFELSQGNLSKKSKRTKIDIDDLRLPPIRQMVANKAKEKDWDNALTIHQGERGVRTWSVLNKKLGKYTLTPPNNESAQVIAITHCGHFGVIGTDKGNVHLFNLQSGAFRRTFKSNELESAQSVSGIAVEATNRHMIVSYLDGTVSVFDFTKGVHMSSFKVESSITSLIHHPDSNLIGLALSDHSICIADFETNKIVRQFKGHKSRITDLCFSPDGRWVVSGSYDGSVRVWDLPSGHMIDVFKTDSIPTALSFSANGEFLATSHADHLGVFLWNNRSLYQEVSLRKLNDSDIIDLSLPTTDLTLFEEVTDEGKTQQSLLQALSDFDNTQLEDSLITLSRTAWAKWHKLLNLEIIKNRNKPKIAPKAPERAPFFLSLTQGVNPQFTKNTEQNGSTEAEEVQESRLMNLNVLDIESELIQTMKSSLESKDFQPLLKLMESLSPPQVDVEIRMLRPVNNLEQHQIYLDSLLALLQQLKAFEVVQAYLQVYLKVHSDLVLENPDVFEAKLSLLSGQQGKVWGRLEQLFHQNLAVIQHIKMN